MFCSRNQFVFSVGVIKLRTTSRQSVAGDLEYGLMEISLMPQPEFVSRNPNPSSPCSSNKKLTSWVSLVLLC